jgi:hypothetical protein
MANCRSNLASRKAIWTVDLGDGGHGVAYRLILVFDGEAGDQQRRIGYRPIPLLFLPFVTLR